MNILLIFALTIVAFKLAYRFYGRYLDRVFDMNPDNSTPAESMQDSKDYVPGKWQVVFSHHFSSIAGGGPIVGPAIAAIYGFYPSWIWIIVGAIFIGAVHDFTALFVSMRERGKSIAEVAHNTFGKTGYALFIIFVLFMVVLVTAAFLGLTSTALSSLAPATVLGLADGQDILRTVTDTVTGTVNAKIGGVASTSVIIITAMAPFLGWLMFRMRMSVLFLSIIAVTVAAVSISIGLRYPLTIKPEIWMVVISFYVLLAAGLPVWMMLQPRDFINSFILYAGIVVLSVGIFIGGLSGMTIKFPSINATMGAEKLGPIWPVMFITIACGAISGFHSLIASGTTSKQIAKESHARRIAFGGMLLEGLLAVAVLITLASVLDFSDYVGIVFPSEGRSNPVLAFSLGMGKLLSTATSIPVYVGTIFGILLVEGFLVTTLDTAVRLNRYLFEELWQILFSKPPALLRSYLFNAGLSVALMYLFAYKQAFLALWPVFGSSNQLLAALALITVSAWLIKRGKNAVFAIIPAAFMIITTVASLAYLMKVKYLPSGNTLLAALAGTLIVLASGIAVIAMRNTSRQKSPSAVGERMSEETKDYEDHV